MAASFPGSVASKPTGITDGLQILAAHVSSLWDEVVQIENELIGSGGGSFTMDLRPSAAGSVILQSRQLAGDSSARFQITGNGDLRWGSGTAATDLTLARTATRTLTLTGSEVITPGNAADIALTLKGAGSQTGSLLELQDSASTVLLRVTAGGQVILQPAGTPTTAAFGIQFGNDSVANLYRSTNSTVKSDGNLIAAGTMTSTNFNASGAGAGVFSTNTTATNPFLRGLISGDSQDRFSSDHAGLLKWGPGASTPQDTNLYRNGAGILKTDGQFVAGGALTSASISTGAVSATSLAVSGSATAATKAVDTNTTDIATTAFVIAQTSAVAAADVGTVASVGTGTRFARSNHVHRINPGIYDTTGAASRLNPMVVFNWVDNGFFLDVTTNGKEMYAEPGYTWTDLPSNMASFPAHRSYWAAMGGTLQWRWYVWFGVISGSPTTLTCNLRYTLIPMTGGTGQTPVAVVGLSGLQAPGGHSVDSGWDPVPAFADGMIAPGLRMDKTGADCTINRTVLTIQIRNV